MSSAVFLPHADSQRLFEVLHAAGYQTLAPRPREGAIEFAPLDSARQLPWGLHDQQGPGHYRLEQDHSPRAFAWANGPQALKPLLFAPQETLWQVERDAGGQMRFAAVAPPQQARAVIGVRPCDLAALKIHDAHFLGGERDGHYAARRQGLLLVAVNCSHPAETCFCVATGDGPAAAEHSGYDLLMDELDDGFILRAGSETGQALLGQLALPAASAAQAQQAERQQQDARDMQQRGLPKDVSQSLQGQMDHPRWQQVAERCLACGNCTSVCPTCFCHSEREQPALDGVSSEHLREWDSCFTSGHSYLHGHLVRESGAQRYRQWLMHKLAWWPEQFGRIGCVGCGRCISWCPVGIDITAEAAALCQGEQA